MSNLKIYGVPLSRAYRALWMANELGLDYENVPIHFADGSAKTPEYLAVNPNGRIPAIDDNGFKLWESMAINLYLAKKHGSGLLPKTMEDEAHAIQWSFWVMCPRGRRTAGPCQFRFCRHDRTRTVDWGLACPQ
jgi:glutathione S-transferase